ncbi:RING-type E3 ubiquitin transferase [Entamoeba marina]
MDREEIRKLRLAALQKNQSKQPHKQQVHAPEDVEKKRVQEIAQQQTNEQLRLKAEEEKRNKQIKRNTIFVDTIVLTALTTSQDVQSIDYLVKCLITLDDCFWMDKSIIEMAHKKLIDYMIVVFQCIDSFPSKDTLDLMVLRLFKTPKCKAILNDLFQHPDLIEIVEPLYDTWKNILNRLTLTSAELLDSFSFLVMLLQNEVIALNIVNSDDFLPQQINIRSLANTLIGKLLRLFTMEDLDVFGDPMKHDFLKIIKILLPISENAQRLIGQVFACLMKFEDSKQQFLQWIDYFVQINSERQKFEFDRKKVFSDTILLLFYGSLGYAFRMIYNNDVDHNYFFQENILSLQNTTLCRATSTDVTSILFNNTNSNNYDITHSVYPIQANASFPVSMKIEPTASTLLFFTLMKISSFCLCTMRESTRDIYRALSRATYRKDIYAADILKRMLLCRHSLQLNKESIMSESSFVGCLIDMILSFMPTSTTTESNACAITPLPLAFLPEYVLGIITDYMYNNSFIRTNSLPVTVTYPNHFEVVLCSLISSEHLCHNPFLRAELGDEFVQSILTSEYDLRKPFELLHTPFCKAHAIYSLLCFYNDCEKTGSHSQYYDKINWRRSLQECFQILFRYNDYKTSLINIFEKRDNRIFPAFVQHIVSDTNLMLDDSLLKLGDIKNTEDLMKDPEKWKLFDKATQDEMIGVKEDNKKQVKSLFGFTSSTFNFLKLLIQHTQIAFLDPVVVKDVAACCNYFLSCIVGKRSASYKVGNYEEYNFRPKELLSAFFDIYVYLGTYNEFVNAIYSDSRSFELGTFETALTTVLHLKMKNDNSIQAFQLLIEKLKNFSSTDYYAELENYDNPDDFCCSLMGTLMKDPVELPNSKMVVDRVTIEKHLMNSKEDPYDRTPLDMSMVIPLPDLKSRIEEYVSTKVKELNL